MSTTPQYGRGASVDGAALVAAAAAAAAAFAAHGCNRAAAAAALPDDPANSSASRLPADAIMLSGLRADRDSTLQALGAVHGAATRMLCTAGETQHEVQEEVRLRSGRITAY